VSVERSSKAIHLDNIRTSSNPSTPSIGHRKCGSIFNFIDEKMPKRYSSERELKNK
jgi:hypothetical protein